MAWPTVGQRALWRRTLRDVCTVTHTPLVSDGRGGFDPGTPTTTVYACRVQPATTTPQEIIQAGGEVGLTYWEIQLPHDVVLDAADTVTADGWLYQVRGSTRGRSNRYGVTAYCTRAGAA